MDAAAGAAAGAVAVPAVAAAARTPAPGDAVSEAAAALLVSETDAQAAAGNDADSKASQTRRLFATLVDGLLRSGEREQAADLLKWRATVSSTLPFGNTDLVQLQDSFARCAAEITIAEIKPLLAVAANATSSSAAQNFPKIEL